MSEIAQQVAELESLGVELRYDDGGLRYEAPKGVMNAERLQWLRDHKPLVISFLQEQAGVGLLIANEADRFEPFPLTEVQSAYLLGRNPGFVYGGVACHVYLELEYEDLDSAKLEMTWNRLIDQHDMLRSVVDQEGFQQVLKEVPHFVVKVDDYTHLPQEELGQALQDRRESMGHRIYPTDQWPLFDLQVTKENQKSLVHFSMDFLVADWASIAKILTQLETLYKAPTTSLPITTVRFRDYVIAEKRLQQGRRYRADRQYWQGRLDELPSAPQLPANADTQLPSSARFRRYMLRLDQKRWTALSDIGKSFGLTPSGVVLAIYASVLERWSASPHFSLNLTLLNRMPLHPEVSELIGDFTSVNLLEVDWRRLNKFIDRAQAIGKQLFEDLDHRLYSGVEVIRDLARERGRPFALMPFVFTSAIGLSRNAGEDRLLARIGYGITQTPQVFIDCQAMDDSDGLRINWDVREGVFPEGMVDDMFSVFQNLLEDLSQGSSAWITPVVDSLPRRQFMERQEANSTSVPQSNELLHEAIFRRAEELPGKIAIITPTQQISFSDLVHRISGVRNVLREHGGRSGDNIAIWMEKGAEQVVAVLATLSLGAAYLPIDSNQPAKRRDAILRDAGVKIVLTQSWIGGNSDWPDDLQVIPVDLIQVGRDSVSSEAEKVNPDTPAYVIYTSGSTGLPKGVVISHRAAVNTILDVQRKFGVNEGDRVLGISNLGFDLSVYDIFGLLGCGGTLVYPSPDRRIDPSHWIDLIQEHSITIWNSVPALAQMLLEFTEREERSRIKSLRLALLSGDWIPINQPALFRKHAPNVEVISLGGATEAAIWSNFHACRDKLVGWMSIPYGKPLANQYFRVLDSSWRDCPDWVAGDLYIGGMGLALEYLGDEEKTKERFVLHPFSQERLYRTGDLGRYRPGGIIEFLGRSDAQVKIRGHRIELGEIESVLAQHPSVSATAVTLDATQQGERTLVGFIQTRINSDDPHRSSPMGQLKRLVERSADREVQNLAKDQMVAYSAGLERAVLGSMLTTLQKLDILSVREGATLSQRLTQADIEPCYKWLVQRWLVLLEQAAILRRDPISEVCEVIEQIAAADVEERWRHAEQLAGGEIGALGLIRYIRSNVELLPELLQGKADPVTLLFPQGRLEVTQALYRENVVARYMNRAVSTVLHRAALQGTGSWPLRVLEIGGGTGGTTESVLEVLSAFQIEYHFTDVSPFFLPEARNRFGKFPGTHFHTFDVDRDYREQALTSNSFDVIIGAGVLENARDIATSLRSLVELLAPGGWLVITEPTREHPWILASQAFMMTRPGDERAGGASYLDRDGWLRLLEQAGADEILCLPEDEHVLTSQGIHLYVARVKGSRAPIRIEELKAFLLERLPDYMVPQSLQILDAFPLTANGKIDRKALIAYQPAKIATEDQVDIETPSDSLESKLASLWAQALGIGRIGRNDSFYDYGADSLIMARMAGRLRDDVADATSIPFDFLLRGMLNEPTVAALARILRETSTANAAEKSVAINLEEFQGNMNLVSFGGGDSGPLRVLFHAGLGTIDCYRALWGELERQALGPVVGIAIADPEIYRTIPSGEVVERLADNYAQQLVRTGHTQFQLVGYSLGGLCAVEVARRLEEQGLDVVDLTLTSCHPVQVEVNEDLMVEMMFLPNLGANVKALGLGDIDHEAVIHAFMAAFDNGGGRMLAGSLSNVRGDQRLESTAKFFEHLEALSQRDRFVQYAKSASLCTGSHVDPDMALQLFHVFRHSFHAARYKPDAYAGTIRFLRPTEPSGFAPGMDDKTLDFWRKVCIGDLKILDIDGNHFSCMSEPFARTISQILADPLVQ